MKRTPTSLGGKRATAAVDAAFQTKILRLIKSAPECRAIKSGEIDAIIDPGSGHVILLPDAQAALLEVKARFRSLVDLSTDGYWEQDEHYRFVSHTGAGIGNAQADDAGIIGKTLWELPFDRGDQIDWPTHRTQLAWRAIFRDLELRCVDSEGTLRLVSISGEPLFDTAGIFTGYRGITRDVTDRRPLQTDVPESDRIARSILDALVTQVCVLDAAGTIIHSNTAWRVLAATHHGHDADAAEGTNYLALCDRIVGGEQVDAIAMAAGIRQVIAGERELFRYEYFCNAHEQRWFMATVMRIRGDDTARAVVSYEDITEIKRAEQLLRLECAIARCLAETDSAPAALQAVIQAVCETQAWDCGQYFELDVDSQELHLANSWGKSISVVAQFLEQSRGARFRFGAGMSGRVCQSAEPLWHRGKPKVRTPMLAHEIGHDVSAGPSADPDDKVTMDCAFAFPVVANNKVIGVLAFASRSLGEPDDRLLRTVRSIGNQLGRFLLQQQSMDTLRQSELRFRRLTELSSDWTWEQDAAFRFTKLAGAGMRGTGDVLGKTLWELPSLVLSEDECTRHKSELQARWSFCDFGFATLLPDGRRHCYRMSGEPLYDAAGTFLGFHGTGLEIARAESDDIPSANNIG